VAAGPAKDTVYCNFYLRNRFIDFRKSVGCLVCLFFTCEIYDFRKYVGCLVCLFVCLFVSRSKVKVKLVKVKVKVQGQGQGQGQWSRSWFPQISQVVGRETVHFCYWLIGIYIYEAYTIYNIENAYRATGGLTKDINVINVWRIKSLMMTACMLYCMLWQKTRHDLPFLFSWNNVGWTFHAQNLVNCDVINVPDFHRNFHRNKTRMANWKSWVQMSLTNWTSALTMPITSTSRQ